MTRWQGSTSGRPSPRVPPGPPGGDGPSQRARSSLARRGERCLAGPVACIRRGFALSPDVCADLTHRNHQGAIYISCSLGCSLLAGLLAVRACRALAGGLPRRRGFGRGFACTRSGTGRLGLGRWGVGRRAVMRGTRCGRIVRVACSCCRSGVCVGLCGGRDILCALFGRDLLGRRAL